MPDVRPEDPPAEPAPTAATTTRDAYARRALEGLPRLLGNLDRNPFSPTYGCFHRDYWLDKTSDFPDAVRQFAVHALALVYRHEMPGNPYHRHPKVRDWTVAALDFWARIQHRDGTFDEFYPFERGWVGPTAFTTYTSIEALRLLGDEVPPAVRARVEAAVRRAADAIAAGDAEEDHLANHHAMACLALWKAFELTGETRHRDAYERAFATFLGYHRETEGWSREYDGIDPGYLSATVSFLGKIWAANGDPRLREVMRASAATCALFAYPDGHYAGTTGSRNTLHFYPHGFELLAREDGLAAATAEHLLRALDADRLVPPRIISDRYLAYRVAEYLLCWLDHAPRPARLEPLPFERAPFRRYLPEARVYVRRGPGYAVANLAKGGALKVFDEAGRLALDDAGVILRLDDGRVLTSQWVDPEYAAAPTQDGFEVAGACHWVPSHKVFSLPKNLLFRATLLAVGWSPPLAHRLKGWIRRTLMLGRRPAPLRFRREVRFGADEVVVRDELRPDGPLPVAELQLGDAFYVRYVPQSRYFQAPELEAAGERLDEAELARLRRGEPVVRERRRALGPAAASA